MPRSLYTPLALCLAAISLTSVTLCKADVQDTGVVSINSAAVQQDSRLEKPVTLSARHITLKAVLDQFSTQTGIALTMEERDPASGYPILVECSKVPVGKMLNALYGLFSICGGEWAWTRSGKAGAYRYAFYETARAKNRADIYNRILKELMTNYAIVLRRLAPMTMEERKKHRAELKQALFIDNEAMIDSFFEEEGFWSEANFFFNALTREEQETVLNGGQASVVLKSLPAAAYSLYRQSYLTTHPQQQTPQGTPVSNPEPDAVQFFYSGPNRSQQMIAPMIQITNLKGSESWMGTGLLDFGVRDALKHAWLLSGDSVTDPSGRSVVTEPRETDPSRAEKARLGAATEKALQSAPESFRLRHPEAMSRTPLDFTLAQLAQGSSTPLLALLPTDRQDSYAAPVGTPVQAFLDKLEGNAKDYFYKWRNGVVLVNDPFWFTEPSAVIPYSLLAMLHPDKQGRVPLSELANLMGSISEDQAQWLAAETNMKNAKQVRLCLLLIASERRVLDKEGVTLAPNAVRGADAFSDTGRQPGRRQYHVALSRSVQRGRDKVEAADDSGAARF